MFLGVNMFLALLRAHFNPRLRLGQKWAWVGPKRYLRPRTSTLLLYYKNKLNVYLQIHVEQFLAGPGHRCETEWYIVSYCWFIMVDPDPSNQRKLIHASV